MDVFIEKRTFQKQGIDVACLSGSDGRRGALKMQMALQEERAGICMQTRKGVRAGDETSGGASGGVTHPKLSIKISIAALIVHYLIKIQTYYT